MDEKVMWAAVAAAGGWTAGQFWAVARDLIYRFWVKRAITAELTQILEETRRLGWVYERALQLITLRAVEPTAPLPISTLIYSNHYKDAVFAFNLPQRIAVQMIHAYVGELNSASAEIRALFLEYEAANIREGCAHPEYVELFYGRIKGVLMVLYVTQWHIRHYLEHPILPDLDFFGPTHAEYLKHLDVIKERIAAVEKSAEGLKVKDFEKPFSPDTFRGMGDK